MYQAQKKNDTKPLAAVLKPRGSLMSTLQAGDVIGIPCDVTQGPFSDERLITFDTLEGPVTGFVQVDDLMNSDRGWLVRAVVLGLEEESVSVRVRGSFLTTNGLATIPREKALAA